MSDDGPTIDHDERVARLRDAYMDASVRMMGAANKYRQLAEMARGAQQEAMEAATEQEAAFHEWHQAAQQRDAAEADLPISGKMSERCYNRVHEQCFEPLCVCVCHR